MTVFIWEVWISAEFHWPSFIISSIYPSLIISLQVLAYQLNIFINIIGNVVIYDLSRAYQLEDWNFSEENLQIFLHIITVIGNLGN